MAISWMTAFKVIPWRDVIAAAPTVAQGAKKLWSTVKSRTSASEAAASPELGSTESRLRELEDRISELKRESTASSELIKSLAEQNTRLVEAVEILRVRTRALLVICLVLSAFLLGLGTWLLLV